MTDQVVDRSGSSFEVVYTLPPNLRKRNEAPR